MPETYINVFSYGFSGIRAYDALTVLNICYGFLLLKHALKRGINLESQFAVSLMYSFLALLSDPHFPV